MIQITHRALQWFLTQHQTTGQDCLLLTLQKSGCSGFAYHPFWANQATEGYREVLFDESLPFRIFYNGNFDAEFTGTIVDFEEKGFQRQLIWLNPNVTQTCGCGASVGFEDH